MKPVLPHRDTRAAYVTEQQLQALERAYPAGMSVQQIVDVCAGSGAHITEATFRKYVQLGLLPRSVRVGRKGKHKGSLGLYPVSAVRQIERIRALMADGHTIEEIRRDFLFLRGEIEVLSGQLNQLFERVELALSEGVRGQVEGRLASQALAEARQLGDELLGKLGAVERLMSTRARMERAAV